MSNHPSHFQQFLGFCVSLIVCYATSAIGAVGSFQAPSFYASLTQPDWAPPAWLFGPVWAVLYTMIAISAWLVWRSGGFKHKCSALFWFVLQLILNALWSWWFFAWQQGALAFINIVVLWVCIAIIIQQFWSIQKTAAIMLAPYLLWVTFASALNFSMWQLNPAALG